MGHKTNILWYYVTLIFKSQIHSQIMKKYKYWPRLESDFKSFYRQSKPEVQLLDSKINIYRSISSVQSPSRVWLFETPWITACQAYLSITNSQSSLKLTSIELVMQSSHLILRHPFSSCPQFLPASESFRMSQFFASCGQSIGVSAWASVLPMNTQENTMISFRMDWLALLAVQGTVKSLLQHHSSKASILWHSAFFTVQLSHPYMTTGKTIALTRRTFVGKVISLLFNMLSSLVITFLSRSKCLLISWLQSPSAVILEHPPSPQK